MTRERLPDTRKSITHTFRITGEKGPAFKMIITVGLYLDGRPGEIFLTCDKEGSEARGAWQAAATTLSLALQHGTPLESLANKLAFMRHSPSGFTNNPDIPIAKSPSDYIGRWLLLTFCKTNNTTKEE